MPAELCEACGENPPTVHYVEVVGGEKRTRAVCDACLSDKGFVIDPGVIKKAADHLVEHMQDLLGGPEIGPFPAPSEPIAISACAGCGLSWDDFKENSRFGCQECYAHFQVEVDGVLERLHGATLHHGRIPKRMEERPHRQDRSSDIRAELDDAIRAEDYERAARLRDALRTLGSNQEPDLGVS
ncbi:MAG: UvrB/UvrC motif-containing protein [Planctomycetota bacterium]|nr:UvrB/UvrC motif-containing protein [Planctomycetota bacterium]